MFFIFLILLACQGMRKTRTALDACLEGKKFMGTSSSLSVRNLLPTVWMEKNNLKVVRLSD